MRAYAYLWLSPKTTAEEESRLRRERETALRQACFERQWDYQGLEIDRSLNTQPTRRPVLRRLLKQLGERDILLVDSLLDLGRRFNDTYAPMACFRQTQSKGSLVALREDLCINAHEANELWLVLSRIPQLQAQTHAAAEEPAVRRSQISRQNGGACPYGYSIDPDTNEYVLVDHEAKVVQRIFKDRARGRSLRQIAEALLHEGVRTKRGGRWQANTIKSILENPFYMGVYQTHYTTLHGHHPAVISTALYYELNAHLICDDIAL